jgi:uncharacterized protein (DUF3084 family)
MSNTNNKRAYAESTVSSKKKKTSSFQEKEVSEAPTKAPTKASRVPVQVPVQDPRAQVSPQIQVSQKTLEKIISQNNKIISKLDSIYSSQKELKNRLTKIEGGGNSDHSEEIIKVISSFLSFYHILNL